MIEFEIPQDQEITFELFDINGTNVYRLSNYFHRGVHQLNLRRDDIGLNKGIYYYQIHSQQRSLIRKMIVL